MGANQSAASERDEQERTQYALMAARISNGLARVTLQWCVERLRRAGELACASRVRAVVAFPACSPKQHLLTLSSTAL